MEGIKSQKSFTLIELLIVIAIIAIIAGAVLVAINPAMRLAEAQDSRRYSEVRSILSAVNTYIVDNGGNIPSCGSFDLPNDGVYRWLGTEAKGGTWPMNLPNQTVDTSGNNNDFTNNGATQISGPSNHAEAYSFNGADQYIQCVDCDTDQTLIGIENNFTIALWINPNIEHGIDTEATAGTAGTSGQFYAFNPNYMGTGNGFGAGISVGTNGISVYEQGPGYMPPLLAWTEEVSGWTHIAIVYNDRQPSLYVNGEWKRTGLASIQSSIHPFPTYIGASVHSGPPPPRDHFDGGIDDLLIFDYAMSKSDIQAFYSGGAQVINGLHYCDLEADLVNTGFYLSSIPQDPTDGDTTNSGYLIKRDPSGTISVKAPHASDYAEQEIMVSR